MLQKLIGTLVLMFWFPICVFCLKEWFRALDRVQNA